MHPKTLRILLADDDIDDCFFFKEALAQLAFVIDLKIVENGEDLMNFINQAADLPHMIFLDMNMPRKNGMQCLAEIKQNERLKDLPVVILSTSFDQRHIDEFTRLGARNYIRKPNEFSKLGVEILDVLTQDFYSYSTI